METKNKVTLPEFKTNLARIHIVGKTPLITHAWSAKAIKMMLDKQMGIASSGKEKKDPFADFKSSLYKVENGKGYGMPAPAFKAAAVSAANMVELKMTQVKIAFHVMHYTVPITGPAIKSPLTEWDNEYAEKLAPFHALGISMRMDLVRVANGNADLRFRAWWPEWKCVLEVEYNEAFLTLDQMVNLIRAGGNVGIGEWRPGAPECRSGEYGRYEIQSMN